MASTKEQAEAYNYEGRRQATSLMTGRDEARTDPRRRINRVTVGGVLVGVLVMAGFGIAGFFGAGRGPALPQSGAVLVAGSGDRYVIVDGRLHPALNLASALLVGGGQSTQVRPAALDDLPRGLPVGIPDAPDALPPPDRLTAAPWTVCAVPSGAATLPPQVTLRVGAPEPALGRLAPDQAVLAGGPDGALWLLNQGRRYRLLDNAAVRLLPARTSALPLSGPLLDVLPEGPPIAVPAIPNAGVAVPGLGALAVADVVRVGSGRQSFVVLADGLAPASELTAALLVAAGAVEVPVDPATVNTLARSRVRLVGDPGWPEVVPQPVTPQRDQPLCLATTPGAPAGDAPWGVTVSLPGGGAGAGGAAGLLPWSGPRRGRPGGRAPRGRGAGESDHRGRRRRRAHPGHRLGAAVRRAHHGRRGAAALRPGRGAVRAGPVRRAAPGRSGVGPGGGGPRVHRALTHP